MSKSSKDCSDNYEYVTIVLPVPHDFRVLSQDIVSDRNAPYNSPALNTSSSQTSKRGWAQETMNNRPCYITHTQANSVPLHPIVCVQVCGMFELPY